MDDVEYQKIDDDGLHISIDGKPQLLGVDTVIVCAGQLPPERPVRRAAGQRPFPVSLIGGASEAAELDAKRAINQASYLATAI